MSRTWSPRGPRAAHPPPHAARRDHVRPGEARPRPATTCGGPRLSCGVPEPRKRGSPPPRSHTPRDADLREAQHTQGPVSTVRAADTPPRAAPPRARRAQLLTSMMQFAASAAAIFTQVLRPPRPPPFFSLPPDRGPPFTRGSTARPPRPRHKSLLARKAVHLEGSHCHWMVCPSIKPQVPAPPSVQRTIPSWRLGREQLPVYLNQCA